LIEFFRGNRATREYIVALPDGTRALEKRRDVLNVGLFPAGLSFLLSFTISSIIS
jgi:hypothetical protein